MLAINQHTLRSQRSACISLEFHGIRYGQDDNTGSPLTALKLLFRRNYLHLYLQSMRCIHVCTRMHIPDYENSYQSNGETLYNTQRECDIVVQDAIAPLYLYIGIC